MAFFDKNISRIKMVILTTNTEKNVVWYSPVKHNTKSTDYIINNMLRRFSENLLRNVTNKIQFYEKGFLIAEVTL
ncbi:hypothetical protein [Flavobacterium facile]|uniref:hypothetical protein n=1 Tax=Flavobacterium facile TaxID=2893174 RepID=UPI002E772D57|nr:hypothetical protein [Flavobacterium sp. T-12]